ncbi:hypothetical protein Tco_0717952 [Tanacetum coccineum]
MGVISKASLRRLASNVNQIAGMEVEEVNALKKTKLLFLMGTHAANGSICSSDLMGAGAGTFLSAVLSAHGYQQRQADMTYILMLDENIDMLRLIMVRLSPRWSRISDEHRQVNKSPMQPIGTHAANGSICSSDLIGAGAGTFLSAILSA